MSGQDRVPGLFVYVETYPPLEISNMLRHLAGVDCYVLMYG